MCALYGQTAWPSATDIGDAYRWIRRTVTFWRDGLKQAYISDHPLRPALQRSALAIKGMTCMPNRQPRRRSPRRPQRVTKEESQ